MSAYIKTSKGYRSTREHNSWTSMKQRCYNPKTEAYEFYGAKGIKICDRWQIYEFFLKDMGPRPEGHSLGRLDSSKDYYPENCRWEDQQQQRASQSSADLLLNPIQIRILRRCRKFGMSVDSLVPFFLTKLYVRVSRDTLYRLS